MVILILLEFGIAQVAPQDRSHAKLVGQGKGFGDLDQLAVRVVRAEVDGRADGRRAHIIGLLDRAEQDLLEAVRVGQQLIVVDLHQEGNLVCILAGHHPQHAERRSDCIAATFDRQTDDILRVEVIRILGKAGPTGMLDALVHRQDGQITRAGETAVVIHPGQVAEHTVVAVGMRQDAVHEIGTGQVQVIFGNFR